MKANFILGRGKFGENEEEEEEEGIKYIMTGSEFAVNEVRTYKK
jgi:hypothetical protein